MRRDVLSWLIGALLWSAGPPVWAQSPIGECNKTFETDATGYLQLSTKPSKLCSLDCLATAANGWAAAWDTPNTAANTTATSHTQAKVVAENGAATAGNSASTGETARYTEFGLSIETSGCIATGSWKD